MSDASPLTQARLSSQRTWARLLIWFIPLLWTVNLVIVRKAPGVVSPHVLAIGRWAIAGLVMGWVVRHSLWSKRAQWMPQWWRFLVLGACGMWVCGAWVYLAGRSTQAMNISLIYASSPVLIALGASWWLGERMSGVQRLGVALALTGVVHVVVQGEWQRLGQLQFVPGDLWVLGAAVAWALYALLQRRWLLGLGPTEVLALSCWGGVIVMLPFGIWELLQPDNLVIWRQAAWMMLLAALLPGVLAYGLYGWAQKMLGVGSVAVTLYLGPLYAALAAWLLLSEPLGWHHATGAALVLSGVALVTRRTA